MDFENDPLPEILKIVIYRSANNKNSFKTE